MHSVQSVSKQSKLSRRQRRRHRYSATSAKAAAASASQTSSSSSSSARYICYKVAKAYRNTVPIVHGIVVSNISLVLLQKEYIEQFYFEKRSGGGGPDLDADADPYRHLKGQNQARIRRFNTKPQQAQALRFG